MKMTLSFGLLFCMLLAVSSCKKEGLDGTATISGAVKHHDDSIPNAIVYIKFGATELPGTDPANFDESVAADHHGAYTISNLNKGDYYLFSIGFDSTISDVVQGGLGVTVESKGESQTIDIAVTE